MDKPIPEAVRNEIVAAIGKPLRKIVSIIRHADSVYGTQLVKLECGHEVSASSSAVSKARCRKCQKEMRAALTAAQQQGQAVAVVPSGHPTSVVQWLAPMPPPGTKLYTAPQPMQQGGGEVCIEAHWLENIAAAAALLEASGDTFNAREASALRKLIASANPDAPPSAPVGAKPFVGVVCPDCNAPYSASAQQPAAVDVVIGRYEDATPGVAYIRFDNDDAPDWDGKMVLLTIATQHQEPTT